MIPVSADALVTPAEETEHIPAIVCDIEITEPIKNIAAYDDNGRRINRVWLIVRMFTEPLGIVTIDIPKHGLDFTAIATNVLNALSEPIFARFANAGGDPTTGLPRWGLIAPNPPEFLVRRQEILRHAPAITVVVCTRERPEDLRRCLHSLIEQDYPRFRVLVVDNAPTSERTAAVVQSIQSIASRVQVDYVLAPRPGLSYARNEAVAHAPGEILAWIDDDEVADRYWLAEVARALAEYPEADVIGGVVVPAELTTRAQVWFEQFGGHSKGRGFSPHVFSPATHHEQSPLYPLPPFATGANMVFRPGVIEKIGGFNTALGAGTPAMGSEDTLAFIQVLLAGGTIVYQPTAMTRHYHRPDLEGLRRQMVGYGVGLTAAYTSLICSKPLILGSLLRLLPAALREIATSRGISTATINDDFPRELVRANRRGMLRGPAAYMRGRRMAKKYVDSSAPMTAVSTVPDQRESSGASPPTLATHLGRMPEVFAVSSIGVFLVAYAYAAGRMGMPASGLAYWMGQILVFIPPVIRLLTRRISSQTEPFLLVITLTVNQYLLKVFYSPDQFRFPDELQHWATTTTIMDGKRLFSPHAALPIAAHFPALGEMGAATAFLTGLSVTTSGLIVAGIAHTVFVGLIFISIRALSHNAVLAALTCVIYSTAAHFLFFGSMYIYQTAAVPFLILAIWAFAQGCWGDRLRWGPTMAGAVSSLLVAVSHHATAIVMVPVLAVIGLCHLLMGRPRWRWKAVLPTAFALAIVAGWFAFVATDVLPYLQYSLSSFKDTLSNLVHRRSDSSPAPGLPGNPRWEILVQAVSLLLLLVLTLRAGYITAKTRPARPWWWVTILGAGCFFVGVAIRFMGQQGPEISGRLSTFTYLPIAVLVSATLVGWSTRSRPPETAKNARRGLERIQLTHKNLIIGTIIAALLMTAGRAGGWPPHWGRLPGPYLVSAYERSIDDEGLAAARWTKNRFPPRARVTADSTGLTLMSTYANKDPVREAAEMFYTIQWTTTHTDNARQLGIKLIWVDLRMAQQSPRSGAYFLQDPQAYRYSKHPLPYDYLAKFDTIPGASRIYDSGHIRLYDMRSL